VPRLATAVLVQQLLLNENMQFALEHRIPAVDLLTEFLAAT